MGTFRYPIGVYDPEGKTKREIQVLVDTGATYAWIPRPILEERGYWHSFKQRLRLANGNIIVRDGCEAVVEIAGARRTTVVIFGDPDSEAFLGAVTLEQFSLAPDPVTKRLTSVEALLMGFLSRPS